MNSADRILGTLGHRGWRLKRAWALSRAWDWWRADSSRRLAPGCLRGDTDSGPAEREDVGAAFTTPLRLVTGESADPPSEGSVVSFRAAGDSEVGSPTDGGGDPPPPLL